MNHNYYVYILECADHSYYVGITNDIERRLSEHNTGYNSSCYTYSRRPLKLAYEQHFYDVNAAIVFEKQIKGWRREKKKALIDGRLSALSGLSKCKML
ncbi:MAG: GIY-YIG nuclease family protein [Mucilaginibacter polytrichastri]|nr:GIY-YIG nuclease family protein [Mucilaginibacter polytrichastri]